MTRRKADFLVGTQSRVAARLCLHPPVRRSGHDERCQRRTKEVVPAGIELAGNAV